jgi:peptidyl-dipeptidase Dcp
LFTKFSQNVLAEENDQFLLLKSEKTWPGYRNHEMPLQLQQQQETTWRRDHHEHAICCRSFLTYSDRRDLREKAWRMFINRGDNGDEHDNNANITQILQLRANEQNLSTRLMHIGLGKRDGKTPERAMG